jgi:hypothetical protein
MRKSRRKTTNRQSSNKTISNGDFFFISEPAISAFCSFLFEIIDRISAEKRPWESKHDQTNFICSGKFFDLFRSSFKGEKVAVKRVEVKGLTPFDEKVEKVLVQLDHPNVIKLLLVTQNVDYRLFRLVGLIYHMQMVY